METTTPFDLNHAIQHWRQGLAASPVLQREALDELESHLHDSMTKLQAAGLTSEEAFGVCVNRIGGGQRLATEFGKINQTAIWVDRLFWVLVAFQGWAVVSAMMGCISMMLPALGSNTLLTTLLPNLTIIIAAWVVFSKPGRWVSWQLSPLSRRPALFAVGCLIAVIIFQCLLDAVAYNKFHVATAYPFKTINQTVLTALVSNLPANLVFAAWTFVIARKRLYLLKA